MSKLKFTKKAIKTVLGSHIDDQTLVVVDSFSKKFLNNGTKFVCADFEGQLDIDFNKLIAIGGCTCLDKGKELANGKDVIVIPTILSTSCISVNRSVCNGIIKRTTTPIETIICIPELIKSPRKWFRSGFADLFSNISASIDIQSKTQNFNYDSIRNNVDFCFEAISWVENEFEKFDEKCIYKLSRLIHESSLMVIRDDDIKLSSAGEHRMYHNMMKDQLSYNKCKPTHGQLVSIGTLMSAKLFSEDTGDERIYNELKSAYSILGIPTKLNHLKKLGIEIRHIKDSMKNLDGFYLQNFIQSFDSKILEIYS